MGRYIPSGVSKVVFAPSVANPSAPTQAEITAGVVLTAPGLVRDEGLMQMDGWTAEEQRADVPDVASTWTGTIPGRSSGATPTSTHYMTDGTPVIRPALARGTEGFVIRMDQGQAATKPAEVFPVRIGANNSSNVNTENTAATFVVGWSITSEPTLDAVQAA